MAIKSDTNISLVLLIKYIDRHHIKSRGNIHVHNKCYFNCPLNIMDKSVTLINVASINVACLTLIPKVLYKR